MAYQFTVHDYKSKITITYFRLVSAYEDKFKYKMDKFYLPKVQKVEVEFGGGNLSFPNFVNHILTIFDSKNCSMGSCPGIDLHWKPFNEICGFCNVSFQAIAKLETLDEDIRYYYQWTKYTIFKI